MNSTFPLKRLYRPAHWRAVPWILAAALAGVLIAVLPIRTAGTLILLAILVVLSLIDVRIALILTLVVSPLKVLTETELPLARALPIDVGQIALAMTLAIWLARAIAARRRLRLPWAPVYLPLVIFIVAASLSLWNSVTLWTTVKELLLWLQILIMTILTVSLVQEGNHEQNVSWITGGLALAGCVQAIIGIYEFRGGSGAPPLWILDYRYFRAFGSFGQPNPFGAFMGLILALVVGATYGGAVETWAAYRAYRQNHDRLLRRKLIAVGARAVAFLVAGVILAAGLVVSWSRGAWLGFSAAALVLVLFAPRRRIVGLALVGALVAAALIGVVTGLAPQSLIARFSDFSQELATYDDVRGVQINDANYAVVERVAHWQVAVAMATDHPWFGVGFGAYEGAYSQYALLNWPIALGHAHNYYLNLLAETGIVGLSAYLIAWGIIVTLTLRVMSRTSGFRRGVALGILGAWTHLAVHSVFDKLYVNNMFLHLGVMLGLIGALLLSLPERKAAALVSSEPV